MRPWLNTDNFAKDTLSRRTEEKLNKIASRYCSWVRQLPGDDQNEILVNEAQIKELFSHTVQSSTGTSKLANGLRSCVKFEMVRKTGQTDAKHEHFEVGAEQTKGLKRSSSHEQKVHAWPMLSRGICMEPGILTPWFGTRDTSTRWDYTVWAERESPADHTLCLFTWAGQHAGSHPASLRASS